MSLTLEQQNHIELIQAEMTLAEMVRNSKLSCGLTPKGPCGGNSDSGLGGDTEDRSDGGSGGSNTPETSSDDDNSIKRNEKAKKVKEAHKASIRVGREFQANCPPLIPLPQRKPNLVKDRALRVWAPNSDISDTKMEEYISVAKDEYKYNMEQALAMLFWHKHDLKRATTDLGKFASFVDEWTIEEKVLFEEAYKFHGKSFIHIKKMLPHKSIASLVNYYYTWKKPTSVKDRQAKAKRKKRAAKKAKNNESACERL